MTPYNLTSKQMKCLTFIMDYIDEKLVAPSYDEIKDGLGLASKSGVHRLVQGLVDRGWVKRHPNMARSITIICYDLEATPEPPPIAPKSNNWHSSLLLEEAFSQPHVRAAMSDGLRARVTKHIRDIKLGIDCS